jgi:hypothetical protein
MVERIVRTPPRSHNFIFWMASIDFSLCLTSAQKHRRSNLSIRHSFVPCLLGPYRDVPLVSRLRHLQN